MRTQWVSYFGNAYVMGKRSCVIAGVVGNKVINKNHASRQGGAKGVLELIRCMTLAQVNSA